MSIRPPPLDFLPVQECVWAELVNGQPEFISRPRRTGRKLLGIKYEIAGHVWLTMRFGNNYTPGQWIKFQAQDGRIRWCQPDGILIDSEHRTVTIVEFKYQHTETAWWQLFHLYLPVIQRLLTGLGYTFRCVEICKWFDPAIVVPQKPVMLKDITAIEPGQFGVHIWKP